MLIDITSNIDALAGSRAWWDTRAEWLGIAVLFGVAAELFTEFDFLAEMVGIAGFPRLRKGIEKAGLLLLIAALAFEVPVNGIINERTTRIEQTLNGALHDTGVANAVLSRKIELEKIDLKTAQTDIGTISGKETRLHTALDIDEKKLERARAIGDALWSRTLPRFIDERKFETALKGKAKASIQILYDPDAVDADAFASSIWAALSGAGWKVDDAGPKAIPPELAYRTASGGRDLSMPKYFFLGAQKDGVSLVVSAGDKSTMRDDSSPYKVLTQAMLEASPPATTIYGGSPAADLPKGTIRIVVLARS